MATTTKNYITSVSQKTEDGSLGSSNKLSADFADISDSRADKGNYTLQQFFDSYMGYMKNGTFIYAGPDTPQNSHIALWFDTSQATVEDE